MHPTFSNFYYGVHSTRYPSGFISHSSSSSNLVHSLGTHIYIRDAFTLKKQLSFKSHDSVIMVLLPLPYSAPSHVISIAYSGDISLSDLQGNTLHKTRTSQKIVRHGCINNDGTLLAACGEFGVYNGVINVWRVGISSGFSALFSIRGNYNICEFSDTNQLFVIRENVLEYDSDAKRARDRPITPDSACKDFSSSDESSEESFDDMISRMRKRERISKVHYACLFDETGESSKAVVVDVISTIVQVSNNRKGLVAMVFLDRCIVVMNIDRLEPMISVRITGSGIIFCSDFIEEFLYFSPAKGWLTQINVNFYHQECIDYKESNEGMISVQTDKAIVSGNTYLKWVIPNKVLCSTSESSIFIAEFEDYPYTGRISSLLNLEVHKMTCCGLCINPMQDCVAVGDFSGKVMIWPVVEGPPINSVDIVRYK